MNQRRMMMILAGLIFGAFLVASGGARAANLCPGHLMTYTNELGNTYEIYMGDNETAPQAAARAFMSNYGEAPVWTEATGAPLVGSYTMSGGRGGTAQCVGATVYNPEGAPPDPVDPPASSASSADSLTTQQSTSFLAYGLLVALIGIGYIGGRMR